MTAARTQLQRQVDALGALPAAPRTAPTAVPAAPTTPADWVTVMRARAGQVEGQRLDPHAYREFQSLQRQVAQTLAQGFRQDRGDAAVRYASYGEHLATLQRHPVSAPVSRVVLGLVPAGERLPLQRAADEALQRLQAQEQAALNAETAHSLQRQLAELDAEATQPVLQRIQARRGGGAPLPEAVQRHLEQGLNHDLSRVRIHDDAEADHLAKGVNAIAFTTGTDIFFQAGRFNPNTQSGLELLAHEVTHTVQQSQGRVGAGIDPDAGLEAEARQMGQRLTRGPQAVSVRSARPVTPPAARGTGALQRQAARSTEAPALLQTLSAGQAPPAPFGFVWQTSDGGVFLRETPQGRVMGKVPNATRLHLLRHDPKQGLYAVRTPAGLQGWVAASHVKVPPSALAADANLKFYVPKGGEGLFQVVAAQYGAAEFGADARYFTNVLRAVNQPSAFKVTNPKYEGFLTGAFESAITAMTAGRDAGGVQLLKVTPFWLPSPAAAARIKAPSGSFSKGVLDTTRQTFGTAGEQALYSGLFVTGLQVGVLKNLWDALVGLVDLVKLPFTIIKAIYDVIQTALQGHLMARIGEVYAFLAGGGLKQMADLLVAEFKAGWDNKNPLKAWEFRGQVIGYVATEILSTFIPIAGLALKAAKLGKVTAFLASKFRWIGDAGRKAMAMLDKVQVKWPPPGMSPQLAAAGGLTFGAPPQQVSLGAVLRKAGKKVLDAAGLPMKTVLTNRADIIEALYRKYPNFNQVKAIIGTTVNPDHPPLGYLYARLPFNGKTFEYLYLPGENAGKVPLLVIKNGKVDFDVPGQLTLTRKVDGRGVEFDDPSFTPGYRMASMYAQGFRKVLNGTNGQSQLHHLIPDNVARAHPFFQEAMKRGLFGLDEQSNIIEVAENAASLKAAQTLFQQGQTGTLLPPLVHRGPHTQTDVVTRQVVQKALEDSGIRDRDLPKLTDAQVKTLIQEIQKSLRGMYKDGNVPKKNGNQIAHRSEETDQQWA
ncbi:eCIS core domain-containing protein [Deinococcus sp. RM]|uniref:eCIS core domain-containing protein n=1 Tax=Deinococcus sp. RM TaxID=2316359 RepID=UPI001F239AD4|nr:DUF4157 domain-containing protein [Deinococcus sp. RM]